MIKVSEIGVRYYELSQDVLTADYRGAGTALAAIKDGEVVALRYTDSTMYQPLSADTTDAEIEEREAEEERGRKAYLAGIVKELEPLGEVVAGMCSCQEFCLFGREVVKA